MAQIPPQSLRKKSTLDVGFQECEGLNFCCFKPPCLEYFVIAALGPNPEGFKKINIILKKPGY